MASSIQSALEPAGYKAAQIESLFWFYFWICLAVFLLVSGFVLVAAFRKRRDATFSELRLKRMDRSVIAATAATVIVLFVLLVASVRTGRAISSIGVNGVATIEVTGHQWWWNVVYDDPIPMRRVTTANEIYLPVGKPVIVRLRSSDVIHSLWIPNLDGKRDLIPGKPTEVFVRADREGMYRGQCAEFCGAQHAKMALTVHAVSEARFNEWLEEQRKPARQPSNDLERRGQAVFLSSTCAMCHTIVGTDAGSRVGPDLTHFGSRQTIGAATLSNRRDNLAQWIRDAQHPKEGARMPPMPLSERDIAALAAYLENLK